MSSGFEVDLYVYIYIYIFFFFAYNGFKGTAVTDRNRLTALSREEQLK
jgi:hypothetical protein